MHKYLLVGTSGLTQAEGVHLAYLVASVLFILGLKQLSSPKGARKGNITAAVGMVIALGTGLVGLHPSSTKIILIVAGVAFGLVVGTVSARKVKMTAMPQMVAAFNGVGGGAAALVSVEEYARLIAHSSQAVVFVLTVVFSVVIGCVSFAGSVLAFLKLQELMTGRPVTYPGQQVVNALIVVAILAIAVFLIGFGTSVALVVVLLALALVLGVAFVLPIGGADMPVVISMLNAFTGLAVAATGFVLGNTVLIVGGTLVGASGTLLTKMMGDSMGRSLGNVLFAAVGKVTSSTGASTGEGETRSVRTGTADDIGVMLAYSHKVIIVPGYGLAVAQAQHAARELASALEKRGVEVSYAIHPVAGRMPGHMNVLLAEADVPYEQLKEMDEINDQFKLADAVLVVGANDVVNPSARNSPSSPIYGMPILNADQAKNIVFMKRSMRPGFAGVDNDLMFDPKTIMLFGDAKDSLNKLVAAVKAA
ncbi:MAG: NAD(P)(+) transhydrogenase (Re/Si-specific) subunit beta [Acidimicrobiaceae bacterium]|nr:NAD(P)(+) transhydrogenase (Re/Si-specific) subunit beta [Acidimicrobiaceae bacterium]